MTWADVLAVVLGFGAFFCLMALIIKAARDAEKHPQNFRH